MKNCPFIGFIHLIVFVTFFSFLTESSNAQFLDSLALFIVADAENPNDAEQAIIQRLEDMVFDVFTIGQNEVSDASTDFVSLVLISAMVSSGTIAENMPGLIDLPIPVINWEPFLYDALGHQATDGGEFNTSEIEIVGVGHPLAAGLSANVLIATVEKAVSYGMPEGDADIIAVNIDSVHQAVLFGYEAGAEMSTGFAPARRVGTFLLNDVADALTEEGWALFDASVIWAMGAEEPNSTEDMVLNMPTQIILHPNYPNPFNPLTHIAFSIPIQSNVRLDIFNMMGQKVATLIDEIRPAGSYSVTFNASGLSSGIYIYRIETDSFTATRKMLYLK
jgi:hypothetical protein